MTVLLKIKDFVLQYKTYFLFLALFLLTGLALAKGVNLITERVSEYRIKVLQQTIKESSDKIQQLEGQIQLKDAELATLNQKLAESNQRTAEAEARTGKARTVYVTTKAQGPTFVSTDDLGRVKELSDLLNKLYP